MVDFKELIKAGVHFGHRRSVWSPRMEPFIWGFKNNVHLIDVSKVAYHLEKAAQFLEKVAAENKSILWVGTKKPAQSVIYETATQLGMPYVTHRWIGGTLSNYSQVKKSVTKLLHYEDILAKAEKYPYYTKKELNTFQKVVERLKKSMGGIVNLKWPLGAIVLIDIKKELSALREAASMGIPIVSLVDTNSDPSLVDYVIPGNDDAPRSIKFIVNYLEEAVKRGKETAAVKKEEAIAEEKVEVVGVEEIEIDEEEEKKSKRASKKASEEVKHKVIKKSVHKKQDDEDREKNRSEKSKGSIAKIEQRKASSSRGE
ncbi:30S ribosomal protein S2 [Candidatus Dependentiae bacterium]|nr:MAG: 30S ribosomal protein S2 [Candidatus Dependentiae bacterium]